MTGRRPSLKINAISNWTSLIVQVAVGFFLTPFIIRHLGREGYGVWVLVGSFIGYYGLLNLGVGSAITRYISRYSAQNDSKSLNEIANTALVMFCTTGFVAIVLSFFIAAPLAGFFKVTPEHSEEFKRIVVVLGIATGLSFPSGVFSAMLTARECFVAVNVVNITSTLLRTGLTVVILLAGKGLAGIAYPTLAATAVSLVAVFFTARSVVPEFRLQFFGVRWTTLRMLIVYGGFTAIISVADILRFKIDSLVIGKMVGMTEVGVYAIASLLVQYMLRVVTTGISVLTPRFAALDGEGKSEELKAIFLRSLSISSCIACGIAMLLVLFGQSLIFLWVGKEFVNAVPVLLILVVAYIFDLCQSPGIGLMYALNKHRYYAALCLVEAVFNVALSVLLVRHFGIVGVALGTAIPMFFIKLFIQPVLVSRLVKLRLVVYGKSMVPAFMSFFIIFLFYGLLLILIPFSSLIINSFLLFFILVTSVVILYIYFCCLFSSSIRDIINLYLFSCGSHIKRLLHFSTKS